ncbi:MAG TPA: ABC transporter substrate-binding protein, partial [Egibacteraceae bacterium]
AWTLEEVAPRIRAVAAALGVADAGEELVGRTEAEIAAARQREWDGEPPTVAFLYLRGNAGVYLLGGDGSGADSLIEAVGAVDAGSQLGLGPFTPVTTEALVAAAPDVILVMTKGLESVGGVDGLVEIPGIAQTPAGRQRRVVAIEDGLLLGFGPRTATTLRLLADGLHGGG